mgnify:CR=1 FL=1
MSKTESKKAVRKAKRTKASAAKTKREKANEEEEKLAEKKSKPSPHEIEDEKQEKGKKRKKKGEKENDKKRIAKRKKSAGLEKKSANAEKKAKQDAGNDKEESDGESEMKGKILDGKVFLLLGRFRTNRMLLKKTITQNGGQVMDHMTSKVPTDLRLRPIFSLLLLFTVKQATHLLSAEGDDGTKTFKQARMKGLKIITEERLLTWLGENKENVCMDIVEGIAEEEGKKTEFLAVPGEEPKGGGPMPFTPLKPGKDWQCRRVELGQFSPSWYTLLSHPPHFNVVLTSFTLGRRVIAYQGASEEEEEN